MKASPCFSFGVVVAEGAELFHEGGEQRPRLDHTNVVGCDGLYISYDIALEVVGGRHDPLKDVVEISSTVASAGLK